VAIASEQRTQARECLDPEEVAALIDGRLAPAARAAALEHVAGCADCHEVLAQTGRAVIEEDARAPVARPAGFRAWLPAVAAASVILALLAVLLLARRPGDTGAASLVASLPASAAASHLRAPSPVRGGGANSRAPALAVGALLVDLRVAAAAGDPARGRPVLEQLAAELSSVALLDEEARRCREAARAADVAGWSALADAVEQRAEERFPRPWPELGRLLEASRLAAATRTDAFFTGARRDALRSAAEATPDPALRAAVGAVLAAWDRAPRDFEGLERACAQALARPR
jgi:hypothetical protein